MDLPITHRRRRAQGGSSISDNVFITEDLWPDILKRLPAKSICRFQCVCKSWNSLLSSPFFVNHSCDFTTAACSNERRTDSQASLTFHVSSRVVNHQKDDTFTPLHLPLQPALLSNTIIICLGVIHGVVCLYYYQLRELPGCILWNPAIRKCLAIPHGHLVIRPFLGFDTRKNDFKLVRVQGDEYEVFSVRDSLWRRKPLPDHVKPLLRMPTMEDCFVNESIYWVTKTKGPSEYGLLVFECGREEFRTMDLPKHVTGYVPFPVEVVVFVWGGLLAVLRVVSVRTRAGGRICEVWVMQEDGVWRKLGPIDCTGGDIIAQRFRVTPCDEGKEQFECVFDPYKEVYVFEESMLLMDIGKPH